MRSPKECDYCCPENRTIVNVVGKRMTDDELRKVVDGIEALGRVMKCGDNQKICIPLIRFSRELDSKDREK